MILMNEVLIFLAALAWAPPSMADTDNGFIENRCSQNNITTLKCLPNQFCCLSDNRPVCCLLDRPDLVDIKFLRINVWNMWYFWFILVFIMVTCFGGCGYYRRRRWMLIRGGALGGPAQVPVSGLGIFRTCHFAAAPPAQSRLSRERFRDDRRRRRDIEDPLDDDRPYRDPVLAGVLPTSAAGPARGYPGGMDGNFLYIPGGPQPFLMSAACPPPYSEVVKERPPSADAAPPAYVDLPPLPGAPPPPLPPAGEPPRQP